MHACIHTVLSYEFIHSTIIHYAWLAYVIDTSRRHDILYMYSQPRLHAWVACKRAQLIFSLLCGEDGHSLQSPGSHVC